MENRENLFLSFITAAISEDISTGDHTSLATIPENSQVVAKITSKDKGIIAGIEWAEKIFLYYDKSLVIEKLVHDGQPVDFGTELITISGNARSILAMERIALNVMQRMSGISTYSSFLSNKIKHTHTKILDTRKTTPGLRFLEKEAVLTGGGKNHRMGLYDMMMIKDNHIDFAGGISKAIESAKKYIKDRNLDIKIEVEVRNLEELNEVLLVGGIHRIMLDNFKPENIKIALEIIDGKYETEASGGINEKNLVEYAETGVDYISIGALTHTVKNFDISLTAQRNG